MPANKNPFQASQVQFRPARADDAHFAARLILQTASKFMVYILGLGNEARALKVIENLFMQPAHRLSYEFCEVAMIEGMQRIGLCISYPGRQADQLSKAMTWRLIKIYPRLRAKIAIITRILPYAFMKETAKDEYFLAHLSVNQRHHGRGLGSLMLTRFEANAKAAQYAKTALTVDLENKNARRLYEKQGYKVESVVLETNKRVKYLGAGYLRMVKLLNNENHPIKS